jgi:hypothetical protein
MVWVRKEDCRTGDRITITPKDAANWQFEGEPPVECLAGIRLPYEAFYLALMSEAGRMIPKNLQLSDSRICLAGRVMGENQCWQVINTVRFHLSARETDLAHLLTAHAWSPGTVSRVTFYNTRTRKLDRATSVPQVVVADGDQAFMRVLAAEVFRSADIIGVIQRALDRDRLEAVGNKMVELRSQWYSPEPARNPAPTGIAVSVIRRA